MSLAAVVAVALFMADTAVVAAQMSVDRVPAPETVEGLIQASDVIVRGRVTENRDVRRGHKGAAWMQVTAEVAEVVKYDGRLPTNAPVLTFYVLGSQNAHEIGFGPFHKGQNLLLYLKWADGLDGYVIAFGPDGAYEVVQGNLRAFGRSAVARQHQGANARDMLAKLRAATGDY